MPDGQLIEFAEVTKHFGAVAAVSDFSARVRPGVVTGFLGPNGAGKTTTLRMLLGLVRPTSGSATIGGTRYADLKQPARVIGAVLEDPGFRPRRSVVRHLEATAKANGIPLSRVSELIRFVGLEADAESRIGTLSLGMRQRLSAATALLGDPGVLVLDEPANGLDPEGIRWMRMLIRGLADEGRTVLVSSHVLAEVERVADEVLVIARGRLKFAGSMEDFADPQGGPVVVDATDRDALARALTTAGLEFDVLRSGLTVRGSDAPAVGAIAAAAGIGLSTLQQRGPTLEDAFLDLVNDRQPTARTAAEPAQSSTSATGETSVPESLPSVAGESAAAGESDAQAQADAPIEAEAPIQADDDATRAISTIAAPDATGTPFAPVSAAGAAAMPVDAAPGSAEPVPASTADPDERPLPGLEALAAAAARLAAGSATDERAEPDDVPTDAGSAEDVESAADAGQPAVTSPDESTATRAPASLEPSATTDEIAAAELFAEFGADADERSDADEHPDEDGRSEDERPDEDGADRPEHGESHPA